HQSRKRTVGPCYSAITLVFRLIPVSVDAPAPVETWHRVGLASGVALRHSIGRLIAGAAILFTALMAVGLTSPADSPFSIAIKPVFMHVDPAAIAERRARIFGIDLDVRVGSHHLHVGWSPIPLVPASTKPTATVF